MTSLNKVAQSSLPVFGQSGLLSVLAELMLLMGTTS
jgi:hypothetical protein